MDAKDAENNSPQIGDAYISLDTKSKAVFYEVTLVEQHGGATWIELAGLQFQDSLRIPLLFLDKSFAKVKESTIKALFGERKKDGNPKQETGHPQSTVKSLRREGQRRDSGKRTAARVVETRTGHRSQLGPKRPDQNGGNRSTKRN